MDLRKPHKANTDYKPGSGDDGGSSESGPAKPQLFPSSIGVSVLLPPGGDLKLVARWWDYVRLADGASPEGAAIVAADEGAGREQQIWQRQPREAKLELNHSVITGTRGPGNLDWPHSDGLHLRWHCRPAPTSQGYATGTVAVTLFLTNERKKAQTFVERDQRSAFQAELELHFLQGFVARLDPHAGRAGSDWDEAVNALQFRNAHEYGVAHNIGVEADFDSESSCSCSCLRTTWIPQATVEKVVPRADVDCELAMEELDRLASQSFEAVRGALMPLVEGYEE